MLYLIGGCGRSSKSTLAGRIGKRHGVPWFPLDALKMGLCKGASLLEVDPDRDELETADQLWPIIEPLLDHLIFEDRPYTVEGVNLRPAAIARFIADTEGSVRACFLGYPDVAIEAKASAVALHPGPPTDWLHRTGVDNVRRYLEASQAISNRLRVECQAAGLSFFDTGVAFDPALDAAEQYLVSPVADVRKLV